MIWQGASRVSFHVRLGWEMHANLVDSWRRVIPLRQTFPGFPSQSHSISSRILSPLHGDQKQRENTGRPRMNTLLIRQQNSSFYEQRNDLRILRLLPTSSFVLRPPLKMPRGNYDIDKSAAISPQEHSLLQLLSRPSIPTTSQKHKGYIQMSWRWS